ncbi:hypothetical protein EDC01DRAFT_21447 [Geopyxis carbonaria]|nr:hypothetical protein EDC01DRAFT_21447 [Geopyxis carbonaria]
MKRKGRMKNGGMCVRGMDGWPVGAQGSRVLPLLLLLLLLLCPMPCRLGQEAWLCSVQQAQGVQLEQEPFGWSSTGRETMQLGQSVVSGAGSTAVRQQLGQAAGSQSFRCVALRCFALLARQKERAGRPHPPACSSARDIAHSGPEPARASQGQSRARQPASVEPGPASPRLLPFLLLLRLFVVVVVASRFGPTPQGPHLSRPLPFAAGWPAGGRRPPCPFASRRSSPSLPNAFVGSVSVNATQRIARPHVVRAACGELYIEARQKKRPGNPSVVERPSGDGERGVPLRDIANPTYNRSSVPECFFVPAFVLCWLSSTPTIMIDHDLCMILRLHSVTA